MPICSVVLIAVSKKGGSGESTNLRVPLSMSAALCAEAGRPSVTPANSATDKNVRKNAFMILDPMSNFFFDTLAFEYNACLGIVDRDCILNSV